MRKLPAAIAVMLAVLVTVSGLSFPASATEREPIQARARDAWAELGSRIEAGAAYAQAVEANRGPACPVPGAEFVSSFGAPRDGHSHQGNDLMAPFGTTIVAPETGTFEGDGESFYLYADSGTTWFVTHNGGDLVLSGSRVTRGQPVSRVSNTGNAAGGDPHAHVEMHPGDGPAVDPYPVLSEACSPRTEAARNDPPPTFPYGVTETHRWANLVYGRITPEQARVLTRFLNTLVRRMIVDYLVAVQNAELLYHWREVAQCESGGNPTINTGNGYYGSYQFSLSTWRSVGGRGYPHQASLIEQTRRAEILRLRSGLGSWPHCGQYYIP